MCPALCVWGDICVLRRYAGDPYALAAGGDEPNGGSNNKTNVAGADVTGEGAAAAMGTEPAQPAQT